MQRESGHIAVEISVLCEWLNIKKQLTKFERIEVIHHTQHGIDTSEQLTAIVGG